MTAEEVIAAIKARHGYLTEGDLPVLAKHYFYRMTPILARCEGDIRFIAQADNMERLMALISRGGGHVHNLSLPFAAALVAEMLGDTFPPSDHQTKGETK